MYRYYCIGRDPSKFQHQGFGTLLMHAGRDYATREKRAQSMGMFMREVAPKIAHLDPDAHMLRADAAE